MIPLYPQLQGEEQGGGGARSGEREDHPFVPMPPLSVSSVPCVFRGLHPSPSWPPVPPSSSASAVVIISILASRIQWVGPERCPGSSLQEAEEPGSVCVHLCP